MVPYTGCLLWVTCCIRYRFLSLLALLLLNCHCCMTLQQYDYYLFNYSFDSYYNQISVVNTHGPKLTPAKCKMWIEFPFGELMSQAIHHTGKRLYQNTHVTKSIYRVSVSLTAMLFLAAVCRILTYTGTSRCIQVHLVNSKIYITLYCKARAL